MRDEQRDATGGRGCALYRMREGQLRELARRLEEAGYAAVVTEPASMPVLRIRQPGESDLKVVAAIGPDCTDWFRFRPTGTDIAPTTRVDEAARVVLAHLRRSVTASPPREWERVDD